MAEVANELNVGEGSVRKNKGRIRMTLGFLALAVQSGGAALY